MPMTAWAVYVGGSPADGVDEVIPPVTVPAGVDRTWTVADVVALSDTLVQQFTAAPAQDYVAATTDTMDLADTFTTSLTVGGGSGFGSDPFGTSPFGGDGSASTGSTLTSTAVDVVGLSDSVTTAADRALTVTDTAALSDTTSTTVASETPLITTLYSRNRIYAKTGASPPVARYREAGRKKLVIRNVDPGGRSIEVAYTTQHNGQGTVPTTGWVTIAPGQEFVDTATTGLKVYVRSFGTGSALVDVYTEVTL